MLKNLVEPTVSGSVHQNTEIPYQTVYESYQLLKHSSPRWKVIYYPFTIREWFSSWQYILPCLTLFLSN